MSVHSGESGKLLSQVRTRQARERDDRKDWKLDLARETDLVDDGGEDSDSEVPVPVTLKWTCYDCAILPRLRRSNANGAQNGFDAELVTDDIDDVDLDTGYPRSVDGRATIADLARSIAVMDRTKVLPRLSVIPPHGTDQGADGGKFSSQASLDVIFTTGEPDSRTVDTFVTSTAAGHTQIFLDDSVVIGSCEIRQRIKGHASHPRCSTQVLLGQPVEADGWQCHYISLPLETLGSSLMHVVSLNTKRLQSLMAYITQTVRCMQRDFRSGVATPHRWLQLLGEDIDTSGKGGGVQSELMELTMTGRFSPCLLAWLKDVIREANVKRWDNLTATMYNHLSNHVLFNLIPGLERLHIAISEIRGTLRAQEDSERCDVSTGLFAKVIEQVSSLQWIAEQIRLVIMAERKESRAFIKFLRTAVEVAIAGPGSQTAAEIEERESANMDYALITTYINNALTGSKLCRFLDQLDGMKGAVTKADFFNHPMVQSLDGTTTKNMLRRIALSGRTDVDQTGSELCNTPALTASLVGSIRLLVSQIKVWQSRAVRQPFSVPLVVPLDIDPNSTIFDIRMIPDETQGGIESYVDIIAGSPHRENSARPQHQLRLCRVSRRRDGLQTPLVEHRDIELSGAVQHAAFAGLDKAIVLLQNTDLQELALIRCDLFEQPDQKADKPQTLKIFAMNNPTFTPGRILVGGRERKKVCLVFDNSGSAWKIFDLEAATVDEPATGMTEESNPSDSSDAMIE